MMGHRLIIGIQCDGSFVYALFIMHNFLERRGHAHKLRTVVVIAARQFYSAIRKVDAWFQAKRHYKTN